MDKKSGTVTLAGKEGGSEGGWEGGREGRKGFGMRTTRDIAVDRKSGTVTLAGRRGREGGREGGRENMYQIDYSLTFPPLPSLPPSLPAQQTGLLGFAWSRRMFIFLVVGAYASTLYLAYR